VFCDGRLVFCTHFIARAVAAREVGYEVVVVTHVDRHRDVITKTGLRPLPLQVRYSSLNPLKTIAVLLQLVHIYKTESSDLIHHVALKLILLGEFAARMAIVYAVINAIVGGGHVLTSRRLLARLLRPLVILTLRLMPNSSGNSPPFLTEAHSTGQCNTLIANH